MSRPASENGPIAPASTGRSPIKGATLAMASTYSPVRPAPTAGTAMSSGSVSSPTSAPTTVGTSSSLTTVSAPNASASTDRSMNDTEAAVGYVWAMRRMASAW